MSNQLASDRRFRILNADDDFTKLCVDQLVAASISGAKLALFLDELGKTAAPPKAVVCDNGLDADPARSRTSSRPTNPHKNVFAERFNGKFLDNCLNQHWFRDIANAKRIVNDLAVPLQPEASAQLFRPLDARRASETSRMK